MRHLLYVPIMHDEADLGTASQVVARQSAAHAGAERWSLHQTTLDRFWSSLSAYFRSLDPRRLRMYQDGLAADGEVGNRIVREAARRGSRNYGLVVELLDRGAALEKTEDPSLLLLEQQRLQAALGGRPPQSEDRLDAERLLEARDEFIARAIDATLVPGELGVLFIGAQHRVTERLPADISVTAVKEPELMQNYVQELIQGRDDQRLAELARRLGAPIRPGTAGQGVQASG